jgi:hypothetical protein
LEVIFYRLLGRHIGILRALLAGLLIILLLGALGLLLRQSLLMALDFLELLINLL